jgi:segregation and condensation protein A
MHENETAAGVLEATLQVSLPAFEGPLDLLLHLIKKDRLNIYDIPIARITEDYLRSLEQMSSLNLESAGNFLEMAATLAYIKSRMLIPRADEDEVDGEEDPRLQVVRPLLVYAAMQKGAGFLRKCPILGLDQFRFERSEELLRDVCGAHPPEPAPLEGNLYELLRAYWRLRKRSSQLQSYQITEQRLSVTDRIQELLVAMKHTGRRCITDLCRQATDRRLLVVTFLALLEMIRSRVVRTWQPPGDDQLWIVLVDSEG